MRPDIQFLSLSLSLSVSLSFAGSKKCGLRISDGLFDSLL